MEDPVERGLKENFRELDIENRETKVVLEFQEEDIHLTRRLFLHRLISDESAAR
jgi:hypothetical protein